MKTLLWLDDYRNPFEDNSKWLVFSPIEQPFKVIWCKSYEDFKEEIMYNGLPDAICFDHDLDPNQGIEGLEIIDEKTGYDCAKWLIWWCTEHKLQLPLYNIQSANPIGKENIDKLLKNYLKHEKI